MINSVFFIRLKWLGANPMDWTNVKKRALTWRVFVTEWVTIYFNFTASFVPLSTDVTGGSFVTDLKCSTRWQVAWSTHYTLWAATGDMLNQIKFYLSPWTKTKIYTHIVSQLSLRKIIKWKKAQNINTSCKVNRYLDGVKGYTRT